MSWIVGAANPNVALGLTADSEGGSLVEQIPRRHECRRFLLPACVILFGLFTSSTVEGASPKLFPNHLNDVGNGDQSIAVSDFNGDGILDLGVSVRGNTDVPKDPGGTFILLGRGDGTFVEPVFLSSGSHPVSSVAVDLNLDGVPDLVVANGGDPSVTGEPGDLSIFLGAGNGAFAAPKHVPAGDFPSFVAVGDFNSDGRKDLAVSSRGDANGINPGDVTILLGDGRGGFGAGSHFEVGYGPVSVAVGDLNADGIDDLVVVDQGLVDNPFPDLSNVLMLLGKGDGTFLASQSLPTGRFPVHAAIGDFNADGTPDLAIANTCDDSVFCSSGTVSILIGVGDGSFVPHDPIVVSRGPRFIAVGDFDADGHRDLAVAQGDSGGVSVLMGRGDGSFEAHGPTPAGYSPMSLAVADFDNDGREDLAVGNSLFYVSVLLGGGDGTFGPRNVPAGSGPSGVAVGDFNHDGRKDLAVSSQGDPSQSNPGDITILLGDGRGGFLAGNHLQAGLGPASVAVGDVNADGNEDLIVANQGDPSSSDPGDVSILLGAGNGTFPTQIRVPVGIHPYYAAIGDFNRDGRADLGVANYGIGFPTNSTVSILIGVGNGTFRAKPPIVVGSGADGIAVGDFDGDGRQDLAVALYHLASIAVLKGHGDGTFDTERRFAAGNGPTYIATGDFNADGAQDLVTSNAGSTIMTGGVSVLEGIGNGTFKSPRNYVTGAFAFGIAIADFDSDGSQDLAVADNLSNDVTILPGLGDGTFGEPSRFAAGGRPGSIASGDFDSDGFFDLAAANFASNDVSILLNQSRPPNRSPVARAVAPQTTECTTPAGAGVTLDGSGSSDPDSSPGTYDDIVSFEWFENLASSSPALLGSGVTLHVTSALGTHYITLKVKDKAGATSTADVMVTVVDTTPPRLLCPVSGPVECSAPGGSAVSLMATATDACSPTVTLTNNRTGGGADASGFYPLGTTGVPFTAMDASGNRATCSSSVQVRDTTPPSLRLAVSPTTLWPPNHRMVSVESAWQVSDVCDPAPGVVLASATSSDPDDAPGSGDGNTAGDIAGADVGTPDTQLSLRAERSGDGPGRTYTLTYAATDASGNTTSALGLVTVPHDLGEGPEPLLMNLEPDRTPGMVHLYWSAVDGAAGYDVVSGDLGAVTQGSGETWLGPVRMMATGLTETSYTEDASGAMPATGHVIFYLIEWRDGSGLASGYGTESAPWPLQPTCDGGCPEEVAGSGPSAPARVLRK